MSAEHYLLTDTNTSTWLPHNQKFDVCFNYLFSLLPNIQQINSDFLFNVGVKRIQVFQDVQLCHREPIQ
jgi:hypothetical protein